MKLSKKKVRRILDMDPVSRKVEALKHQNRVKRKVRWIKWFLEKDMVMASIYNRTRYAELVFRFGVVDGEQIIIREKREEPKND